MKKPENYSNIKAAFETKILKLGGHHLVLKDLKETTSKKGQEMIVTTFDCDSSDAQSRFFAGKERLDLQTGEVKWPFTGTKYILVYDKDGNDNPFLISFYKAVEASNPEFAITWCDGYEFGKQFIGRKVGGVFGNVEHEYNGVRYTQAELFWFCDDATAGTQPVPKPRLLSPKAPSFSLDQLVNG